jgi:hypothetical protein
MSLGEGTLYVFIVGCEVAFWIALFAGFAFLLRKTAILTSTGLIPPRFSRLVSSVVRSVSGRYPHATLRRPHHRGSKFSFSRNADAGTEAQQSAAGDVRDARALARSLPSMEENQFGFEYSWTDLRPVRTLMTVVLVFQVGGALLGLLLAHYSGWFSNVWAGGAIATLPGFVVGFIAQRAKDPASISINKVMVRRLALVAALLSLSVFIMPLR